jgi:hypothetical protein
MSETENENQQTSGGSDPSGEGIPDEQLPEDLQPSEDNPLAEPLGEDVDTEDLDMEGGKGAEQWDDEELED